MSTLNQRSRLITAALSIAIVALIVVALAVVLPRIVSYGELWGALRGLSWLEIAVVTMATVVNVLTFGPALMAALPGIRYPPALAASLASSASTYVAPGGPAVGWGIAYLMLRARGIARRRITLALSLVAVGNQLVTLAMPPLALAILWLEGGRDPLLERMSQVGLALFALIVGIVVLCLYSASFARRAGDFAASALSKGLRLLRREPVSWSGEQLAQFRSDALQLLRSRWHWLTVASLSGHLTVYLVLIVTLRAIGVGAEEVSLAESFAAWAVIRLLGAIPIVPGGFGVVEVGLTTALIGFGGDEAGVVASVLVYRFLTVGVPLVCGILAGAMWRRGHPGEVEQAQAHGI